MRSKLPIFGIVVQRFRLGPPADLIVIHCSTDDRTSGPTTYIFHGIQKSADIEFLDLHSYLLTVPLEQCRNNVQKLSNCK